MEGLEIARFHPGLSLYQHPTLKWCVCFTLQITHTHHCLSKSFRWPFFHLVMNLQMLSHILLFQKGANPDPLSLFSFLPLSPSLSPTLSILSIDFVCEVSLDTIVWMNIEARRQLSSFHLMGPRNQKFIRFGDLYPVRHVSRKYHLAGEKYKMIWICL